MSNLRGSQPGGGGSVRPLWKSHAASAGGRERAKGGHAADSTGHLPNLRQDPAAQEQVLRLLRDGPAGDAPTGRCRETAGRCTSARGTASGGRSRAACSGTADCSPSTCTSSRGAVTTGSPGSGSAMD